MRNELRTRAYCCVIVVVTWLVYFQVRNHEFVVFDDPLYLSGNTYVLNGLSWEGTVWAFTNFVSANWHPLTWLSHMLDAQLFGMDARWHILENVLWHTCNALLLFWFCRRLGFSQAMALGVAAVFAIHPQNIEAVAWASQRKSLLNTAFMLVALNAYVEYGRKGGFTLYGIALVSFILSLLAKSMSVTLPVILLLLDIWPLGRIESRRGFASVGMWSSHLVSRGRVLLLEKLPFFALSLWISVVTVIAQESVGAVASLEGLPLWVRVANAVLSIVAYIKNGIVSSGLSVFYARDYTYYRWEIAASSVVIVLLLLLAVLTFRRRPAIAIGFAWFVVTLLPVIGLVQVGSQARADRYFYVPSMGLLIMFAGLFQFTASFPKSVQKLLRAGVVGWAALLAVYAFGHVKLWRTGTLLFADALENGGTYPGTYVNLSASLLMDGRREEAVKVCDRGLAAYPFDGGLYNNRAGARLGLGDVDGALADLAALVALRGFDAKAHIMLASAYVSKGMLAKAEHNVNLARALLPRQKQWDVSLENLKGIVNSPDFHLEHIRSAPPRPNDMAVTTGLPEANAVTGKGTAIGQ